MKKYLMEGLGTFLFVFTIALVATQGVTLAPIAIGTMLGVLVYAGAHISGSHYNPAVTLAVYLRGKISLFDGLSYRVAQCIGAVLAIVVASSVTGEMFVAAPGADMVAAMVVEIIFTFTLAMVVLHTATTKSQAGNSHYGFAIGLTVMCAIFAGGAISGGAFNPAVGFVSTIMVGSSAWWLYLVGPLVGGALAGGAFHVLNGKKEN